MTRQLTLELQRLFPVGTRVYWRDPEGAVRIGDVVRAERGDLVVSWPPHSRASGVPIATWRRVVRQSRIDPRRVIGLVKHDGGKEIGKKN